MRQSFAQGDPRLLAGVGTAAGKKAVSFTVNGSSENSGIQGEMVCNGQL